MSSILIVDDSIDNRNLLRVFLSKKGHHVAEAADGARALEYLKNNSPDLILLDIVMPGMDGFEVCEKIKDTTEIADIPVIFLSAQDQIEAKVKGFQVGAADYITKPFEKAEVMARVKTHLQIHSLNKSLLAANHELKQKQSMLEADLKAAAEIQLSLLPKELPNFDTCKIVSRFLPSDFSSGDIFNVHQLDHDTLALYIVDVSGHGVPAAMVTVSIAQTLQPHGRSLLKNILPEPPYYKIAAPLEVITKLDEMYPLDRFEKYFTIVYLQLNLRTGLLHYCNAGHPYPAITARDDHARLLKAGGSIIGMGDMVPLVEDYVQLEKGDRVFLYTDGVTELVNKSDEQFGIDRLVTTLDGATGGSLENACDQLLDKATEFASGRPAEDDITLLALEYTG